MYCTGGYQIDNCKYSVCFSQNNLSPENSNPTVRVQGRNRFYFYLKPGLACYHNNIMWTPGFSRLTRLTTPYCARPQWESSRGAGQGTRDKCEVLTCGSFMGYEELNFLLPQPICYKTPRSTYNNSGVAILRIFYVKRRVNQTHSVRLHSTRYALGKM